jgi:hypothetical protein
MKHLIYSIMLLISTFILSNTSHAQSDNTGLISLATYLDPEIEELTKGATSVLKNKLSQIVTDNGMSNGFSRFLITANVVVLDKDVQVTAVPINYSYTIDVSLYIGDGVEGNKFCSHTITLKGVGDNQTKALINAFKNINVKDKAIQAFVSKGKSQIVNYFSSRCDVLIRQAKILENQNHFDEAIYSLVSIPEASACYDKALTAAEEVYNKKLDRECGMKLSEAKNYWNSHSDLAGADVVARILSGIDPRSSCYSEVTEFANTVGKRVLELDGRAWKFITDRAIDLERDRIKAMRDIGVAWGNGQPNSVAYNIKGWW